MDIEQRLIQFSIGLPVSLALMAVLGYGCGTCVAAVLVRWLRRRRSFPVLPEHFFGDMTEPQRIRAERANVEGFETGMFAGARVGFAVACAIPVILFWLWFFQVLHFVN